MNKKHSKIETEAHEDEMKMNKLFVKQYLEKRGWSEYLTRAVVDNFFQENVLPDGISPVIVAKIIERTLKVYKEAFPEIAECEQRCLARERLIDYTFKRADKEDLESTKKYYQRLRNMTLYQLADETTEVEIRKSNGRHF